VFKGLNSDATELPRRKQTIFRTRRKFEIRNIFISLNRNGTGSLLDKN